MSVVQAIFRAYANADKVVIDMKYLPDTVTYKFWLTIQNQSLSMLYFKIVNNIPNWTLTSPSDGNLGSVSAGSTSTFTATMSRSKPSSETTDAGSLTIEAYTDSGYTNKIGETTLNVTVYFEDLESWTDVQIFESCQGWSANGTLSSEVSVDAGGLCIHSDYVSNGTAEKSVWKSITLPNRNKVRLSLYFLHKHYTTTSSSVTTRIDKLVVKVGSTEVFNIPSTILTRTTTSTGTWYSSPWTKIAVDLSEYRGQTVTITITFTLYSSASGANCAFIVDYIVVAGKD